MYKGPTDPPMETADQKRDVALFFKEEGDEHFSPKRNQAIIKASIKKNVENRKRLERAVDDKLAERTNAIMTWLTSPKSDSGQPIEKYFGKRWMAYLRGMEIMDVLKAKLQSRERKVYLPK